MHVGIVTVFDRKEKSQVSAQVRYMHSRLEVHLDERTLTLPGCASGGERVARSFWVSSRTARLLTWRVTLPDYLDASRGPFLVHAPVDVLQPFEAVRVTLEFAATSSAEGVFTTPFEVAYSNPDVDPEDGDREVVVFRGTASCSVGEAELSITPAFVDFRDVDVHTRASARVSVLNTSPHRATVLALVPRPFSVASSHVVLEPHAKTELEVTFAPEHSGHSASGLVFFYGSMVKVVPCVGNGGISKLTADKGVCIDRHTVAEPAPIDFGLTRTNAPVVKRLTVTNVGTLNVVILSVESTHPGLTFSCWPESYHDQYRGDFQVKQGTGGGERGKVVVGWGGVAAWTRSLARSRTHTAGLSTRRSRDRLGRGGLRPQGQGGAHAAAERCRRQ